MLPRVTFSTLACPDWSVETIITNARLWGFDGIEWRGGSAGHIRTDSSPAERAALREQMRDAALFSAALTAYSSFVSDDAKVREANAEHLKLHLDLAAEIDVPFVRTFVGEFGPHQTHAEMIPRVVEALRPCVEHAHRVGVGIVVEHHDAFVHTGSIVPILNAIPDPSLGALWDIANAYSVGDTPERGFQNLNGRILHVHVKDGVGQNKAWRLTNVGEGDVPLRRGFQLLRANNYSGAYSIEWEYAWHPELEPPERALPNALRVIRTMLAEIAAGQGNT